MSQLIRLRRYIGEAAVNSLTATSIHFDGLTMFSLLLLTALDYTFPDRSARIGTDVLAK